MADWDTRLAVSYDDGSRRREEISPIDSFTPTFALNAEALHSIEDTHIGVVYSPQALSFSMTVRRSATSRRGSTALALDGQPLRHPAAGGEGTTGRSSSVVMSDCIITERGADTAATVQGAPRRRSPASAWARGRPEGRPAGRGAVGRGERVANATAAVQRASRKPASPSSRRASWFCPAAGRRGAGGAGHRRRAEAIHYHFPGRGRGARPPPRGRPQADRRYGAGVAGERAEERLNMPVQVNLPTRRRSTARRCASAGTRSRRPGRRLAGASAAATEALEPRGGMSASA